jgi:hypothetical protein
MSIAMLFAGLLLLVRAEMKARRRAFILRRLDGRS